MRGGTVSNPRVPVWLKPRGMTCVVVGGGPVAARRAGRLAEAGAEVVMLSPTLCPEAAELVQRGFVAWRERPYRPGDLAHAALAVAATDDPAVNAAVREEARSRGIWCNRADDASDSDLDFASVTCFGDVSISIATGGKRPDLAKRLRQALEDDLATGGDAFIRLLRQCAASAASAGDDACPEP
ncbi:precorrin-2 dehydrogenase/sirohydrochlorin ferrochelatase family protein [Alicyclobacillus vulcanalis]|uniref:precorrin-2 dehydrogenase n=1 Tax=Alicyclobacillus vulcanalis TaxID=252246 RepID=A0A1N7JXI9_9BACL|nr:bifunctional precorrin-2 dehydrogenase/sirohydrochlorin ferrochelatase [Alicyclobacillus vulcanalis]SIS54001.1 precorrin-2 dehydrogenase [Alicyclobacillus vulcanalis]